MVSVLLLQITIAFISILTFNLFLNKKSKNRIPTNWPVIGMFPGLIHNLHHFYDWSTGVLEANSLTILFKGPWFAAIDMVVTVDPANIHYIMSSNFANFSKGPDFNEIFEVLGDGIFNSDSCRWKSLRSLSHATISKPEFQRFLAVTTRDKVETGLIPVLDHFAKNKMVMDLQDVFERFTSDTTSIFTMGYDPKSLSIDLPILEFFEALSDVEKAIFGRHLKPRLVWKMQGLLGLGEEKKVEEAGKVFDGELAKFISLKKESGEGLDLLTSFMNLDEQDYEILNPKDEKFLKDMIMAFVIAGRDTTGASLTWFFWLISKNPEPTKKIRHEIESNIDKHQRTSDSLDFEKLVYLHCAICESLRLYPPVPLQRKSSLEPDILPSGHRIEPNTKVLFSLYGLGRMRSVWGDDAWEFKPERWMTAKGRVKHEPSYKFLSFNAGPRTCLGKGIAMDMMKIVAVEMLLRYDIEVVEGHVVEPSKSMILRMKHGLNVTVSKRCLE